MKTMKHTVALMVLVGASSAFALDADFNTIDADGNGAISMEEASKYPELMSQFKDLDTDMNGELSEQEFAKAQ
ncbi:calmodulin [Pseudoalteromonas ruthenica]|uniref:calmodulin n=1 Tax=Pseudoalteromonas ruthenica TaxID=151081 RepID=UPI00110A0C57|nr:calmodulin [Pseudoalteromonas ruthenica]TMO46212.1 calmodulin [Pseudoalteromonas ruthenica]TMO51636.1 calmodulin [Pseudoalteromonas ruthenica]